MTLGRMRWIIDRTLGTFGPAAWFWLVSIFWRDPGQNDVNYWHDPGQNWSDKYVLITSSSSSCLTWPRAKRRHLLTRTWAKLVRNGQSWPLGLQMVGGSSNLAYFWHGLGQNEVNYWHGPGQKRFWRFIFWRKYTIFCQTIMVRRCNSRASFSGMASGKMTVFVDGPTVTLVLETYFRWKINHLWLETTLYFLADL